jgi:murein DD-endopeptidase MepM/ murein hydrolase activator NlpD
MIRGKGMYVWNADRVLRHSRVDSAQEAASLAQRAGIEHVLIKIADGEKPFPIPGNQGHAQREAITVDLIQALRDLGIEVWGWAFAYGPPRNPETQAAVFADRARRLGLSGLVIDAEDHGPHLWSAPGGAGAARAYVQRLRAEMTGVHDLIVGLSSYRYIRYHRSFPFAEFMSGCDIAMPQVYWVARSGGDPVRNLQDSFEDYKQDFPHKLFLPTGAAYGENQGTTADPWYWSATPAQIRRFLDQAKAMGLSAVTFWSWEHALNDPSNLHFRGSELWDAIAQYPYRQDAAPVVGPGAGLLAADDTGPTVVVSVNDPGYVDGRQPELPGAVLSTFDRHGKTMKFAPSLDQPPASVWALWRPNLPESGTYEISVWVPGEHGTVSRAHYQIHGVVGEPGPVTFLVDQRVVFDEWVSLGYYQLNVNDPHSGQVRLTNLTGQSRGEIAFADIRWRRVQVETIPSQPLADGFDPPVGTEAERRSQQLWPGHWIDANGFNNLALDSLGRQAFHTGADLNLNVPTFDLDRDAPVFAIASGVVTFVGRIETWGMIIIIRHDPLTPGGNPVYARYAHVETPFVNVGQRVRRGQVISRIGKPEPPGAPFHLHFDISPTKVLEVSAGDWPGPDQARVLRDYVDPAEFIRRHRPPVND